MIASTLGFFVIWLCVCLVSRLPGLQQNCTSGCHSHPSTGETRDVSSWVISQSGAVICVIQNASSPSSVIFHTQLKMGYVMNDLDKLFLAASLSLRCQYNSKLGTTRYYYCVWSQPLEIITNTFWCWVLCTNVTWMRVICGVRNVNKVTDALGWGWKARVICLSRVQPLLYHENLFLHVWSWSHFCYHLYSALLFESLQCTARGEGGGTPFRLLNTFGR